MTPLERWDLHNGFRVVSGGLSCDEIRRAIAIAQAVEEEIVWSGAVGDMDKEKIMRRADELLKEKK